MLHVYNYTTFVFPGNIIVSDGVIFNVDSDLNGANPQFTLICTSTGGPATTTTWTRDFDIVTEETETVLDDQVTAQYTHTLTVTGRLRGLYTCTVANDKPSEDSAQLNLQGTVYPVSGIYYITLFSFPAPSSPSFLNVSQDGQGSVLVSWTPPSGDPAVTGYIIYYQQDGGQRFSQSAGSTATNVTIIGLIAGITYSVTMLATSTTLPSNETEAESVMIGIYCSVWRLMKTLHLLHRGNHHLPYRLSLLPHHGWRKCHSHLLCHSPYWSNWYSKLSVGGAWNNSYPS